MCDPLVAAAVRNNALWCDAVCRAHGLPTRRDTALWRCLQAAPPFYPNAITLEAGWEGAQLAQIAALQDVLAGEWAVKDSHAALDLAPLGFAPLFDAVWISRPAAGAATGAAAGAPTTLRWSAVRTPARLVAWERAWAAGEAHAAPVFPPALLHDPEILFLAGERDGNLLAGGVLNRSPAAQGAVVGVSNLFAQAEMDGGALFAEFATLAAHCAPGCAIVGYESGAGLASALNAGFVALQPLRVWVRGNR